MLVQTLLFILLSPGVLLTLPAGSRGIVMSGQTSFLAVLVHAVLFYFLVPFLEPLARRVGLEGFQGATAVATVPINPGAGAKCTEVACGAVGLKCCPSGECGASC
jgi:hypothetical protein